MFVPRKSKYRKAFKGSITFNRISGTSLSHGLYGLKAIDSSRIDGKQLESARRSITRALSRSGKVWIRVFPTIPVSKKPTDVRMGKGKGAVDKWVFRVSPGKIIFEVGGLKSSSLACNALQKASAKMPFRCRIVSYDMEY